MNTSIFDQRYGRCLGGIHKRGARYVTLLTEPEWIKVIEGLCDELAQEKQKVALLLAALETLRGKRNG